MYQWCEDLLGILFDQLENYERATVEYEQALKIDPNFSPAANNLAWIYSEQGGDLKEALNLAQIAFQTNPEDPHITDTLGWIYYKKKAYIQSIRYLRESKEKLPNNPIVRYHLGMAYYKADRNEQAKQELEASLSLSGKFPGSKQARETIQLIDSG